MRVMALFIVDLLLSGASGIVAFKIAFAAVQHFEGGWVRQHVQSSTAGVGIWVDSWAWGIIAGTLTSAILFMTLRRRRKTAPHHAAGIV